MERAHISDDEESKPIKRVRRIAVVSDGSSEDEALVVNQISDDEEHGSTLKKYSKKKAKESSVYNENYNELSDIVSTSSDLVMQSVVIELPLQEISLPVESKKSNSKRAKCRICLKV